MLSGAYDVKSCLASRELEKACMDGIGRMASTECAHLFSESAQDGDQVILFLPWRGSFSKFQKNRNRNMLALHLP